jgi:hypothetical protein
VLFTDGASNGVPADWEGTGLSKSLRTWDFPHSPIDPDGQTWDKPHIDALFDAQSGVQNPSYVLTDHWWYENYVVPTFACMPPATLHTHHRSPGIPTSFPLQTGALTVNGSPQNSIRGLRNAGGVSGFSACAPDQFPAEIWNVNNAARNVLEIIADQARRDVGGDYPIHIYTIGMSYLVRDLLGTIPEMPEDILKRVSNDPTSADYNASQLSGKYFYAAQAADVAPAFQGIQNEILRLSR